jgi:hypothetical protein
VFDRLPRVVIRIISGPLDFILNATVFHALADNFIDLEFFILVVVRGEHFL